MIGPCKFCDAVYDRSIVEEMLLHSHAICLDRKLAAESRARAEAEAREAVLFDLFMTIPRRRRIVSDSLRSVAIDPRADAYRQACQDIEDEIRAQKLRVSPIALALVELERAARETAFGAGSIAAPSIGELRDALANLDRARGGQ